MCSLHILFTSVLGSKPSNHAVFMHSRSGYGHMTTACAEHLLCMYSESGRKPKIQNETRDSLCVFIFREPALGVIIYSSLTRDIESTLPDRDGTYGGRQGRQRVLSICSSSTFSATVSPTFPLLICFKAADIDNSHRGLNKVLSFPRDCRFPFTI